MSNWFRVEDGNKLDLFLEFLDSVSICLKLTESFPFMWWYYELYRLECKNVKLAQILSVTLIVLSGIFYLLGVEIGPFGIIWKWIGVCELL